MDLIRINNGYNPFLIKGYGGLGYHPKRNILGDGGLGYHPARHIEGGALYEIVKFDKDTRENVINLPNKETPEYTIPINEYSDTGNLWDFFANENATTDDRKVILNTIIKKKEKRGDEYKQEYAKYKEEIKKNPLLKNQYNLVKLTAQEIQDNYVNNDVVDALIRKYKGKLTKTKTKAQEKQLNDEYTDVKIANKVLELEENKDTSVYAKQKYRDALKNTIKFGLNKMKEYSKTGGTLQAVEGDVNVLVADYNNTNPRTKLKIEGYSLEKITKVKEGYKYEKNLTITKAKEIINKYWSENEKIKLEKDNEFIDSSINKLISNINKADIIDDELPATEYEKAKALRGDFPDKEYGFKYMKTIKVNGKYKFLKEDGKPNTAFMEKEYSSAGKPAEFCICGIDNPLAKKIYDVAHPNMEVTDYIVENITGKQGKSFPIDNVDLTNKIFSEMKYYQQIHYRNYYNINIQLKQVYKNMLFDTFVIQIKAYEEALLEGKEKKAKVMLQNIKAVYNVLTNKDEFNKDFYKNRLYMGVGITINKFNPVKIPEGYDFEGLITKERIDDVKSEQGQIYIPHITNRKVTAITRDTGSEEQRKLFDKEFKKKIGTMPYTYDITCVCSDAISVYEYSNDDYVENDFILGTYQSAYSSDDQKGKFGAVLIPIEKFTLKRK